MRYRPLQCLAIAALVGAFASLGTPARAQTYTGRIDVTVEDSTGGRLPGVTVELSEKRMGRFLRCQRMAGFHLPPITASVTSTGQ